MSIELVPAEPQHVNKIARICFEAFKEIHDRGCGTRDFPTVDIAQQVLGMLVRRDDFYGVVALVGWLQFPVLDGPGSRSWPNHRGPRVSGAEDRPSLDGRRHHVCKAQQD